MLIGFAFKVAAVPFHLWSPDVYEGAPTPVTGVMASIVKVGAFAALLRVLISALGTQLDTWRPILFVLIVAHLRGRRHRRPGAAQREAPAGLLLDQPGRLHAARACGREARAASPRRLFFILTYAPVVIATFAVVTLVGGRGDELHSIDHYRGLARRQPWLGGALAVLLLSQLGAPLTVGFYAKYTVLAATIDSGGGALALVAILSAAIAAYFYLRWVMWLYVDDDVEGDARQGATAERHRHRGRGRGGGALWSLARSARRPGVNTPPCSSCREPRRHRHVSRRRRRSRQSLSSRRAARRGPERRTHGLGRSFASTGPTTTSSSSAPPGTTGRRRAEFLAWAKSIKHLVNPYPVIEYSTDKHYLADLEKHGVKIIPSHFCDVGKKPRFFDHDFVVKPCVAAGSRDAERYRADQHEEARHHVEALHAKGLDAVLQPYVESVDTEGERAIIFIDGKFSHAMRKGAMLNVTALDRNRLYREEQISPRRHRDATPSPSPSTFWRSRATHTCSTRAWTWLRLGNEWAIMELELVEPSLYLIYDDDAAAKLATGIARRLHTH